MSSWSGCAEVRVGRTIAVHSVHVRPPRRARRRPAAHAARESPDRDAGARPPARGRPGHGPGAARPAGTQPASSPATDPTSTSRRPGTLPGVRLAGDRPGRAGRRRGGADRAPGGAGGVRDHGHRPTCCAASRRRRTRTCRTSCSRWAGRPTSAARPASWCCRRWSPPGPCRCWPATRGTRRGVPRPTATPRDGSAHSIGSATAAPSRSTASSPTRSAGP